MSSSSEELRMIADLVSSADILTSYNLTVFPATKRGIQCQVRRYEEPQKCHHRLDHTTGTITVTSNRPQRENGSWLQSRDHRSITLSNWTRLVQP
jgi:hypothetical protein